MLQPALADSSTPAQVAVQSATRTLGEPINIVVSNASDPSILTEAGFIDYAHSLNFSTDCLGVTLGGTQSADLGDGLGFRTSQSLLQELLADCDS